MEEADAEDGGSVAGLVDRLRREQQQANEELVPSVAEERLEKLRRRLAKLVEEARV